MVLACSLAALEGTLVELRTGPPEELAGQARALRTLADLPVPQLVDDAPGSISVRHHPRWRGSGLAVAQLAALARTLAEAHRRGITHAALSPVAVVVDPSGQLLLDGWTGAGDAEDDVVAFAALLASAGTHEPLALSLAERARSGPGARPTMAAIAAALGASEPLRSPAPAPAGGARRRGLLVTGIGTMLASALALSIVLRSDTGRDARPLRLASPAPVLAPDLGRRVGNVGDTGLVGDWHCDGRTSPALASRQTGTVWLFDGWTGPARAVGRLPAGAVLGAVTDGACDVLVVVRADGRSAELDLQ